MILYHAVLFLFHTYLFLHFNKESNAVNLHIAVKNVTQCGDFTCLHNSMCSDDGTKCQCHRGYTGINCEQDLDECEYGDPCFHRGYCHNTVGGYGCTCVKGWENGKDIHCEIPNILDEHLRNCVPGWMGDKCQHQCLNSTMCELTQICKRHGRGNQCLCKHEFVKVCKTNENDCKRNKIGSFVCTCPTGWQGPTCSDDIDECSKNPCKNSGVCTNTKGSYSCTCDNGWAGKHCGEDIDECANQPCNDSLICHNKPGTFSCDAPFETKRVDLGELSMSEIMVICLGALLFLLLMICVVITIRNRCKQKKGNRKRGVAVLPEKRNISTKDVRPHQVVREGFVYKQNKPAVQRQVLDF